MTGMDERPPAIPGRAWTGPADGTGPWKELGHLFAEPAEMVDIRQEGEWNSMFPREVLSVTVTEDWEVSPRGLALLYGEPVWRMRLRLVRGRLRRLLRRRRAARNPDLRCDLPT